MSNLKVSLFYKKYITCLSKNAAELLIEGYPLVWWHKNPTTKNLLPTAMMAIMRSDLRSKMSEESESETD